MTADYLAQEFLTEISTSLQSAKATGPDAEEFIDTLVGEIGSMDLKHNSNSLGDNLAPRSWVLAKYEIRLNGSNQLLDRITSLEPYIAWTSATRYWPEKEHEHFTSKLNGAFIVGMAEECFTAADRYCVLLGVMSPGTTYPLHKHGVGELYYIVGGHAEWSHDGINWEMLPPGSVFFNRSNQPHSFRTYTEHLVFLGLYLPPFDWEGQMIEIHEQTL